MGKLIESQNDILLADELIISDTLTFLEFMIQFVTLLTNLLTNNQTMEI